MMPNMDPRTMKNLMAKMGIKSSELEAIRVTIETSDKNIIIESPQITKIEAQGSVSFQISGDISESEKDAQINVTDEDVDLVAEKTNITDKELIRQKLIEDKGDIAKAILDLTTENEN
jgi:nascent polypeptide-associated complex subunit alpha